MQNFHSFFTIETDTLIGWLHLLLLEELLNGTTQWTNFVTHLSCPRTNLTCLLAQEQISPVSLPKDKFHLSPCPRTNLTCLLAQGQISPVFLPKDKSHLSSSLSIVLTCVSHPRWSLVHISCPRTSLVTSSILHIVIKVLVTLSCFAKILVAAPSFFHVHLCFFDAGFHLNLHFLLQVSQLFNDVTTIFIYESFHQN